MYPVENSQISSAENRMMILQLDILQTSRPLQPKEIISTIRNKERVHTSWETRGLAVESGSQGLVHEFEFLQLMHALCPPLLNLFIT